MHISVEPQEADNILNDVWLQVDAMIRNGLELASSKDDSRCRSLRAAIDCRADFIHGVFLSLKRLGLLSLVAALRNRLRQRLNKEGSVYMDKIADFAHSSIEQIFYF